MIVHHARSVKTLHLVIHGRVQVERVEIAPADGSYSSCAVLDCA